MINIPAVLIDRMKELEDRPRSAYEELEEAYQEQEAEIARLTEALNLISVLLTLGGDNEILSALRYARAALEKQ